MILCPKLFWRPYRITGKGSGLQMALRICRWHGRVWALIAEIGTPIWWRPGVCCSQIATRIGWLVLAVGVLHAPDVSLVGRGYTV